MLVATAVAGALLSPGRSAYALTPLAAVRVSADVTVDLADGPRADEAQVEDNLLGAVIAVALGALPSEGDLAAYHRLDDGDHLLVFDTVVVLPGGVVAGPADVVRFDGAAFSIELAGAAAGVPPGARIDALTVAADNGLVASLDVAANFGSFVAADEDLVRLVAAGSSLWRSGAALAIAPELDLDGVHRLPNDHLLVSFDTTGTIAGLVFADEDILEVDPAGPSWELAVDASALDPEWATVDLDALWALPGALAPPPPAGELRFTSDFFSGPETDPFVRIYVERVNGSAGDVSVTAFTADLTATVIADYNAGGGVLSWLVGETGTKFFDVPLIDDALGEGTETVHLALTGPTGGAVLGVPATATLRILDDEAPSEIPALDLRGLLLLAGALAAAATAVLRRRQA